MDEPTIGERLRDLQSDVQRLLSNQEQYVTKEIMELKLAAILKEQAETKERLTTVHRWLWSGVVAPVIVGIILYVLIGKQP
jgi:cytochrome c-type biogenesis protein CcmH/NrfG